MQKEEVQKILFVINPVSGGKEKNDWETTICEYVKQTPHKSEFYLLQGKGDDVSIKHYIDRYQPTKVVAVGGDGTIKMVAELLVNTNISLGILPAGSANGMAKELNIPQTINEAIEVALNGESKPMDAIQINDKEICIHLADMGLNALLVKYFESSSGRGMFGYVKGVFRMLWNKRKIYANMEIDGKKVHRSAYMIVLANASMYGTGATINPTGKADDGIFEVVVVRRLNFIELLKMLITHTRFDATKVEIFPATSITLQTFSKHYFQVDGEYRNRTRKLSAKILPGCINIVTPAQQ